MPPEAPIQPAKTLVETETPASRQPHEKVAIIFNPASGAQDCAARRTLISGLLTDAGLTCGLDETDRERGATPLAEKAVADGVNRLLVSGGDGSVTEAANALLNTDVSLGVLPGGTGNLLALNLGLPLDCAAAMEMALKAPAQKMDVGRANDKVFLIMVGMGVDGRMIQDADQKLKRRLGVLAYFVTAWRHLGRHFHVYTITIDGRRIRRRAQTVLIANLGRITGGVELVPGADPHDGMLEVAILRARSLSDMARVLVRMALGHNHSDNLLEIHHGREIIVRTRYPQPLQVDGNEAGFTRRLEARVQPGSLSIICPACADETAIPTVAEAITQATGIPPAVPIVAGLAAGLGAARLRGEQENPSMLVRYPLLTGIAAALAAALIARLLGQVRTPAPEGATLQNVCPVQGGDGKSEDKAPHAAAPTKTPE